MSEIIERIKKLVKEEDNIELFNNHISLVIKYARRLALDENEDVEAIEIAALLHDLGRIRYGGKEHNLTGAKDAKEILETENYSPEKIEKICNAIISHGGEKAFPVKDKFGEILRCADGLSHHEVVPLFLTFNLKKTNNDLSEALQKLIKKLDTEWHDKITLDLAKKIGYEKYNSAILILKSNLEIIPEVNKNDNK
ncbi:MAG: HD domain-containing protein [Nanoarchaeota archaeon]|nr:HD domain-containing protein [Nanoarchaeota archaeon]